MTPLDLRFALRRLRRHLPASLAAALTLALGIAAVTALFSVVRAVLLRPPPFRDPAALAVVRLHPLTSPTARFEVSYPDYRDWRAAARGFQDLAAVQTALGRTVLEAGGSPAPPPAPWSPATSSTFSAPVPPSAARSAPTTTAPAPSRCWS